jgi:hypothetical protein
MPARRDERKTEQVLGSHRDAVLARCLLDVEQDSSANVLVRPLLLEFSAGPYCRARSIAAAIGVSVVLFAARDLEAQMPGTPVLQNAWASPGVVGAFNFGGGSDGSVYAAAASWTPTSAKLQLSAGIGLRSRTSSSSKSVYGVRLAVPFSGSSGAFGFGAFAGVGGGSKATTTAADSGASTTVIPIGVSLGWRRALGSARGFSIYATPSYLFLSGGASNGGLVRAGVGVDVGITRAFGITAGVDFGQNHTRQQGGPTGTLYGLGASYALGRR